MTSDIDPTIFYCFVLADDDPRKTSPFQGFSLGWMSLRWALRRLVDLPADILEPALPHQAVLARRIGGTGGWRWFPLSIRGLEELGIALEAPFWVMFSGTLEVARGVSAWAAKQVVSPLHVTPAPWDCATVLSELNAEVIHRHVEATVQEVRRRDPSLNGDLIDQALAAWRDRPHLRAGFSKRTHNCTLPNHMTLEAAGMVFDEAVPLIGRATEDYVSAIIQTSKALQGLRRDVGDVAGFRLTPPQPSLIITAPALYRHVYQNTRPATGRSTADPQIVNKVMRLFQRQTSFQWTLEKDEHDRILASEHAQAVVRARQEELEVHNGCRGLAQRLYPGGNSPRPASRQPDRGGRPATRHACPRSQN